MKWLRILAFSVAVATCSTLSGAAAGDLQPELPRAQASTPKAQPTVALRIDVPVDLTITATGAALSLTLELLTPKLAPSNCRWCDRDSSGRDSLNGFDASVRSHLRWNHPHAADIASTVIAYGLAPLTSVGLGALLVYRDDRSDEFLADALIVAEATVIALNLNQISKLALARQRPEIHFRGPTESVSRGATEDNLSFYSGHTTFTFALATSTATVATMRRYRLAPVVWGAGMFLAAATGYLRLAADKHYATDVITGAVLGAAVGAGIPYFAHGPAGSRVALTPMGLTAGAGLALSGTW